LGDRPWYTVATREARQLAGKIRGHALMQESA